MITYSADQIITGQQLAELFQSSGIHRPTMDVRRMTRMVQNANLLVTAWDDDRLVGVARGFNDQAYCCYISDLAIRKEYQKQGIGQQLITKIHEDLGPGISLVLAAAPSAIDYYPKIDFEKIDSGFKIQRKY